jgi:hypothetical protein
MHPRRGNPGGGGPVQGTTQRTQVSGNDLGFRAIRKWQAHGNLQAIDTDRYSYCFIGKLLTNK